jgi:hypothetical protein
VNIADPGIDDCPQGRYKLFASRKSGSEKTISDTIINPMDE